jgi:nitroreductase
MGVTGDDMSALRDHSRLMNALNTSEVPPAVTEVVTNQLAELLRLDSATQDLLFRQARTANKFTPEPVTTDQVRAIYELTKWAPTSMNMQPLRVLLVRSPQARERLLPHLLEANRAKAATAPLTAILSADLDFHLKLTRTFPHSPNARSIFEGPAENRRKAAHLNATLQIAYLILGVRAAGLDAGPMTGFDAEGLRKEFFAGTSLEPLVVLNIGRIDDSATFPRSPRLDYDETIREA